MMELQQELFSKTIFKLNEVCGMTGVKPYVLRFWLSEFSCLKTKLNEQGDRIFDLEEIQLIKQIKSLLFDEKMSIDEAQAKLLEMSANGVLTPPQVQVLEVEKEEEAPLAVAELPPEIPQADLDLEKLLLAREKLRTVLELSEKFLKA